MRAHSTANAFSLLITVTRPGPCVLHCQAWWISRDRRAVPGSKQMYTHIHSTRLLQTCHRCQQPELKQSNRSVCLDNTEDVCFPSGSPPTPSALWGPRPAR
ncbi:hypothetical protein DPEC_G00161730 [Dallia pectoralis]|uniref:Uncharacterized protein n=1 Tax=Dallia pectoralis TaxID=75939 RepID=A0ACC2GGT9_DALPE|nr:hypothetical protein DPEC_G00161730 [Dallia pectoralis]